MTEKMIEDEELKGLEREIDAAVDRLFVEKGRKAEKIEDSAPPFSGFLREKESKEEWQMAPPVSVSPLPSKPFEKLETLLLSLEWEISRENLRNAKEEVLRLRKEWEGRTPEISTLLHRMASVLNVMMQNEEQIGPHLIRFLLDTKETMKLLLRKEEGEDIAIYKKLAQAGIEARFSCLEEVREARKPEKMEEGYGESVLVKSELSEEVLRRLEILSERMDQLVKKLDHHLSLHEKVGVEIGTPSREGVSSKKRVTVFKMGERLFGVESDKVFSLFKVPTSLQHKISHLKKFQLKGVEVKIIPLGTFFSLPEMDRAGVEQILILKDDSEYKGILMNRVLSRLYGPLEPSGELNEYLLGMIRWTYEDLPIKVPILNFKKL